MDELSSMHSGLDFKMNISGWELTGVSQLVALLCAPLFGYISDRYRRYNIPLFIAAVAGVVGYLSFSNLSSPETGGKRGSPIVFVIVSLLGISQIGCIVGSLGLLGRGIIGDRKEEDTEQVSNSHGQQGSGRSNHQPTVNGHDENIHHQLNGPTATTSHNQSTHPPDADPDEENEIEYEFHEAGFNDNEDEDGDEEEDEDDQDAIYLPPSTSAPASTLISASETVRLLPPPQLTFSSYSSTNQYHQYRPPANPDRSPTDTPPGSASWAPFSASRSSSQQPSPDSPPSSSSRRPKTERERYYNLKGTIAGIYSLGGGLGILLLTKLGGWMFDNITPGAPFLMMALFNAILGTVVGGVDVWKWVYGIGGDSGSGREGRIGE
ncbi:MAG: hypothetical protein M1823_003915 [Watsoniomyces obsoletus]|nr:MAG: hypothetical protein M1823_003915 [Watsoniomyces obsoletus]